MSFKDCFGNNLNVNDKVLYLVEDIETGSTHSLPATITKFREPVDDEDYHLIVLNVTDRDHNSFIAYGDSHNVIKLDANNKVMFKGGK